MAKKSKTEGNAGSDLRGDVRGDVRGIDLSEVKRLLAFMQENGLEEFEYERRGVHIRLKKAAAEGAVARPAASPSISTGATTAEESASGKAARPVATVPPDNAHIVKSPIVGTFYAAASPEADPFVVIGASVKTGQVLCIIEAMKLMNEIESDVAGEVVRIFVENGHPVEYGEPLFGIRLSGAK